MEIEEILDIALAQFEDPAIAQTMAAVAMPESFGGKAGAIGDKGSSVGLWQINRVHFRDLIDYGIITVPPEVRASLDGGSEENSKALWEQYAHPQLSDPATNAKAAWMIGWEQEPSRGPVGNAAGLEGDFKFSPWSMYNNGAWETAPADDTQRYSEEIGGMSPIDAVLKIYASREATAPLTSVDDGPAGTFQPRPNTAADDQPSQWGARPQVPGAKGPRWGDTKAIFDPVPYRERVMQAMKDKNTPKVVPLQMEMSGQEFSALQRSTQDPGMRAALSRHADNFRTGDAGFVGYETDEAASTAAKWLRIYGLGVDSQFPFIVYNLGKQAIDKTGDIASQLWDKAIGSLWGGGDDSNRIKGESGLEGKSNYE
tara:strand:+ start:168 stop:1277 length:1110 start_codon:yes stop_codon:yes gene_type:complete